MANEEIYPVFGAQSISIDEVCIPRVGNCNADYIFLSGNCDWDKEHGIEFLMKNGIPIYCNANEGLALSKEWDEYLTQDEREADEYTKPNDS